VGTTGTQMSGIVAGTMAFSGESSASVAIVGLDTGDVVIVTADSAVAGTAVLRVVVLPGRLDVNAYTAASGNLGAVSGNVHYIAVLKP